MTVVSGEYKVSGARLVKKNTNVSNYSIRTTDSAAAHAAEATNAAR